MNRTVINSQKGNARRLLRAAALTALLAPFVVSCSKDPLPGGDTGIPVEVAVGAPPSWHTDPGARSASGGTAWKVLAGGSLVVAEATASQTETTPGTRAATDPLTGKVSWENGDVLHCLVYFLGNTGNKVKKVYASLEYSGGTPGNNDGDWKFREQLFWPFESSKMIFHAYYIGTAPTDGTKFIDQPVYKGIGTANVGQSVNVDLWEVFCTAVSFTGLADGEKIWITGPGWYEHFWNPASIAVESSGLTDNVHSLTAGADGTVTMYMLLSPDPGECKIAVSATEPFPGDAVWTGIRDILTGGGKPTENEAYGLWYTLDVSALGGSGDRDPNEGLYSAEARRFIEWAKDYNAGNLSGGDLNFILTEDIDLLGYDWDPVGPDQNNPFLHTFDGGGHTIRGLKVKRGIVSGMNSFAGMFGYVGNDATGGTIKNVTLEGVSVKGTHLNVGAAAGWIMNGTLENVHVSGSVSGAGQTGGIVGGSLSTNDVISLCTFSGAVTGTGDNVGGIAGSAAGKISGCSTGENTTVTGTGNYVGGIAGSVFQYRNISYCFTGKNNMVTAGGNYVGGIVGHFFEYSTVSNCGVSEGAEIKGAMYVGGVAGVTNGNSRLDLCYSLAAKVTGAPAGGIAGYHLGGGDSCFWLVDSGQPEGARGNGSTPQGWAYHPTPAEVISAWQGAGGSYTPPTP